MRAAAQENLHQNCSILFTKYFWYNLRNSGNNLGTICLQLIYILTDFTWFTICLITT